jgi:hypothetical protein
VVDRRQWSLLLFRADCSFVICGFLASSKDNQGRYNSSSPDPTSSGRRISNRLSTVIKSKTSPELIDMCSESEEEEGGEGSDQFVQVSEPCGAA